MQLELVLFCLSLKLLLLILVYRYLYIICQNVECVMCFCRRVSSEYCKIMYICESCIGVNTLLVIGYNSKLLQDQARKCWLFFKSNKGKYCTVHCFLNKIKERTALFSNLKCTSKVLVPGVMCSMHVFINYSFNY